MKISKLPKATSINDTDNIPIVQEDTTKKVDRKTLIGTVPDDVSVSENHLQLVEKGKPIGIGCDLPLTPPGGTKGQFLQKKSDKDCDSQWADVDLSGIPVDKTIEYSVADLLTISIPGYASYQGFNSAIYVGNNEKGYYTVLSINFAQKRCERLSNVLTDKPILTETLPIRVFIDTQDDNRLSAELIEGTIFDMNHLIIKLNDEEMEMPMVDLISTAAGYESTGNVSSSSFAYFNEVGSLSDGESIINVDHSFVLYFATAEKRDAFNTEVLSMIVGNITKIYLHYTYQKKQHTQGQVITNG